MTNWAGVVRDASSLEKAASAVTGVVAEIGSGVDRATAELRNLTDVARAVLEAASEREETRGCHARSDFPEISPEFRCRLSHGPRAPGAGSRGEPGAASSALAG
jgi:L-aspartate oxidase